MDYSSISSTNTPNIVLGESVLHVSDFVVIVVYFIGIFVVGIWSSRKSASDSVSSYFLASRNMHWVPIGASIFASNIGAGHFIGLAGTGASIGIAVAGYEIIPVFTLMLLGWIFVPVYMASGVSTMPEYLKLRFGGQRIRVYMSLLSLILYVFTKISADLFAGSIFIKQSFNLNMYISICVLLAIAALFTIAGGLTAVIWTDFVQTILMLAGATLLTVLSLNKVGGYQQIMNNFAERAEPTDPNYVWFKNNCTPNTNNSCESCSAVSKYYKHLLHPIDDEEIPATGIIFGLGLISIWYFCSDQVIVQRILSSKNVSHAKGGCILASGLKLLPLYLMVLPGMASRMLWPNEIGCSNPIECKRICGTESGCSNIAYPLLVLRVMPKGATGLMLSVMMAALMSSLTSIFNSASTIFTIDIWTRIRKNCSEIEQVIVGRVFVLVLVVVSIVWIPIIEASQGGQLFNYINSIQSYLAPPVCAVFVLGILWKRINEKGAFWGLVCGLIIGAIRFVMEFSYRSPPCGSGRPDPRPAILYKIQFLHFSIILFMIVCVVTVSISLLTKPIDEIHLYRLTFWTRNSEKIRVDIDSIEDSRDLCNNNCADDHNNNIEISTRVENRVKQIRNSNINISEKTNRKKLFHIICCMPYVNNEHSIEVTTKSRTEKLTDEEMAKLAANNIKEEPFWRSITNIGAIVFIAIGAFFVGFYA